MTKIKVIGMAPFPVALPGGRHLTPGEIADVPDTDAVRRDITNGLLHPVTVPTPPLVVSKPAATKKTASTSEENT